MEVQIFVGIDETLDVVSNICQLRRNVNFVIELAEVQVFVNVRRFLPSLVLQSTIWTFVTVVTRMYFFCIFVFSYLYLYNFA